MKYGGGAAEMVGNLGNTCCSQFDSNTQSEASEVSTVRSGCRARIESSNCERVVLTIACLTVRVEDVCATLVKASNVEYI